MSFRCYIMTPEEQESFDPIVFGDNLLAAGFTFEHFGCPFKLRQPWDRVELGDGVVVWRQWDNEAERERAN